MNNNQISFMDTLKNLNINLILTIFALNIIGLLNLYSATHGINNTIYQGLFKSQIMWLTLGWATFFIFTFINASFFKNLSWLIYLVNIGLLALVPIIGKTFLGAQRWLDLGFFKLQPSETMKFALVLILATILNNMIRPKGLGFKRLISPLIITLIPFALVVKQPDLGTSLLLLAIAGSMLLVCKIRREIIIAAIIGVIVAAPLAWNYGLKTYQKNRVKTFLSPDSDPRGTGYNSIQSKIAVGSGQLLGKGFKKGTQSQLEFLPERHTDFVYSVLSEEHGFIGSVTVIGLFIILFIICLNIGMGAETSYGALATIGMASILFWHFFVNIGMVTGLLPIVGVPLPLLSYGGSSLITTMASLGIISSVSVRRNFF